MAAYASPSVSDAVIGGNRGVGGGFKLGRYATPSSSYIVIFVIVIASPYFSPLSLFAESFGTGGGSMGLIPETSPSCGRRRRIRVPYASSAFTMMATTFSINATTNNSFADVRYRPPPPPPPFLLFISMIRGGGDGRYSRCDCKVSQQRKDIVEEGYRETMAVTTTTTCAMILNPTMDHGVDDEDLRAIAPGSRWWHHIRGGIFRSEFGS